MCLPSVKGVWERLSYAADTYRSTLRVGGPARSYEFPRDAGWPARGTAALSAGNKTPILRAPVSLIQLHRALTQGRI